MMEQQKKEQEAAAALLRKKAKKLEALQRELTQKIEKLYEDNVLGRITNEQFRILSTDYNAEQKELENSIPEKEARLEKLKASVANAEREILP